MLKFQSTEHFNVYYCSFCLRKLSDMWYLLLDESKLAKMLANQTVLGVRGGMLGLAIVMPNLSNLNPTF